MRFLFTIPHFFDPQGRSPSEGRRHGSLAADPRPRIIALTSSIAALHQLYGDSQCIMDIAQGATRPANQLSAARVDVVVSTTQDRHLLAKLPLAARSYQQHATQAEPRLLGFECQAVLRDRLGDYDYYCFLEDDLILHDPWLFIKLAWFNGHVGEDKLLEPNRYELGPRPPVHKAYIDGDLAEAVTARFQNVNDAPRLESTVLGRRVAFHRPTNPHSGCYFLSARQMEQWAEKPYFLDRDTSFVGPLESAATLGIMRAFRIYKPSPQNASFLEIEHFGSQFLGLIRRRDEAPADQGG